MSAPTPPAADRPRRRAMFVVFLVVAIDLLGFGIVLPLVPRYADTLLTGYSERAQGVIIGLMYSSFSLMQFVFSPVWGRVSDRVGRRPILLLGLLGSVVFYALFGYAATLHETPDVAVALLLLSRVGAGIAGASVSTAAAVIADCTPPEKRAKGMALIGAAFGIGFTFGPLIAWAGDELALFGSAASGGVAVVNPGWGPGALASGLSLVALVLAVLLLPETLPPGPKPPREFFSIGRTRAVLRMPSVGALILVYFLAIFAFANFEGTLSLFTKDVFRLTDRDNYLAFAYIGCVLMVAQGLVYRPLAQKRPEDYWVKLGVGLMLLGLGGLAVVAFAAFALSDPASASGASNFFYFSITVAVAGFAFVNPSVTALISRHADPSRQGEVLGVNQSFAALGRILGPFLGALAFKADETRVLPYAVAAGVLALVIGLLPAIRPNSDSKESGPGG